MFASRLMSYSVQSFYSWFPKLIIYYVWNYNHYALLEIVDSDKHAY